MNTDKARIKLIKDINQLLTDHGRPQLTTGDFDLLWDMDIDEIGEVLNELSRQLDSLVISRLD